MYINPNDTKNLENALEELIQSLIPKSYKDLFIRLFNILVCFILITHFFSLNVLVIYFTLGMLVSMFSVWSLVSIIYESGSLINKEIKISFSDWILVTLEIFSVWPVVILVTIVFSLVEKSKNKKNG